MNQEVSKVIIGELANNKDVFVSLLSGVSDVQKTWKKSNEKWCLLEVLCHLIDEEKEDFTIRTKTQLDSPGTFPPAIHPEKWVKDRNYIDQNYEEKLQEFISARNNSISWLKGLSNPSWDNYYTHSKYGNLSAGFFLKNWLAHDHLHIKQITRIKYDYLESLSDESINYAGVWTPN